MVDGPGGEHRGVRDDADGGGSLEKPEQFVAVDARTFRIDFLRKDKLSMPDLAVTILFVLDSDTAKANSGGDV